MAETLTKPVGGNFERKALMVLSVLFIGVLITAWVYAMRLREQISSKHSTVNVDVSALVELEKIRNLADAHIANSRAFFLLGSSKLYDLQKENKEGLAKALADYEKKYSLNQVPQIIDRIENLETQHQEIFDQGMEFRAQQTESKIVGQFYQSKAAPIRDQINKNLDEIAALHNAELNRARAQAEQSTSGAQTQIPQAMTWFTVLAGAIFAAMTLLVVRMLRIWSRQLAERTRLYEEAQKAVLARDEVLVAVSQDLKDPLKAIQQTADVMARPADSETLSEGAELIKSSVSVIENQIQDIMDQTRADNKTMALRVEQLGVENVLDEARRMLQPMAKQKDVRLEFNLATPSTLAFYDHARVLRVLSNLIGNAIKFSPRNSKVIIKARSDQQYVYISVKDSGNGIPEKQLAGIFENFWQARKTADQGAGIGLAIVKTIVEAHGGTVTADSNGSGSTFTFSLPRRRPAGATNLGGQSQTARLVNRAQSADLRNGPTA